ncbi:hypothetical protein [Kitasatospora camelliae]|uniref:Uncharacterized protein n=1 Tax=Kitasatospora camelliae TaxID=3156397 RepID=A0AAU8JMJ0_9ACTN
MTRTPQEIFESYVYAGALTRKADALAAAFTAVGVFEAPLMPAVRLPAVRLPAVRQP